MTQAPLLRFALLFAAMLMACPPLRADSLDTPAFAPPESIDSLKARADEKFDRSLALLSQRSRAALSNQAKIGFADAAALYRLVLADPSLSDASRSDLSYNLGTSLLLAGETAPAIIELRRAETLCPVWDFTLRSRITANLNIARRLVSAGSTIAAADLAQSSSSPAQSPPNVPADPTRTVLSWLALAIPSSLLLALGLLSLLAASILSSLRLARLRHPPSSLITAASLIAILSLVLLTLIRRSPSPCHAVVTVLTPIFPAPDLAPTPRTAPPPSASILQPGAEVLILQRTAPADPAAPEWVRIRLLTSDIPLHSASAAGLWVPRSALHILHDNLAAVPQLPHSSSPFSPAPADTPPSKKHSPVIPSAGVSSLPVRRTHCNLASSRVALSEQS